MGSGVKLKHVSVAIGRFEMASSLYLLQTGDAAPVRAFKTVAGLFGIRSVHLGGNEVPYSSAFIIVPDLIGIPYHFSCSEILEIGARIRLQVPAPNHFICWRFGSVHKREIELMATEGIAIVGSLAEFLRLIRQFPPLLTTAALRDIITKGLASEANRLLHDLKTFAAVNGPNQAMILARVERVIHRARRESWLDPSETVPLTVESLRHAMATVCKRISIYEGRQGFAARI